MATAELCAFLPCTSGSSPRLGVFSSSSSSRHELRSFEFRGHFLPACLSHKQGSMQRRGSIGVARAVQVSTKGSAVDTEEWNKQARETRLQHLEAQALETIQKTVDSFERPAFPCALIAGDVVILDLLHRAGVLKNEAVKIVFVDTFHLFPETYVFLAEVEKRYGFKAHVFHADGFNNKKEYEAKHGSDLFITDIDEYDRICKVEPFNRALETLNVDAMINGRRRDHGAERAHLEVVEAGAMAKIQPIAYWEFRDVWDYLQKYSLPYHPLHDQGFPSVGDVQTTLPVPQDKWFEYGGERSGRFQGLKNADGTDKTECGIHIEYNI
ncbi:unnamed protein product [Sphagnum balticum]